MQFIDIVNEVLNYGFNDGPQVNRSRIKVWVNEAEGNMAHSTDGPEYQTTATITTIPGVPTYNLPADFVRVIDVAFPLLWRRLAPVDIQQFDQQTGDPVLAWRGPPGGYMVFGQTISFAPLPDSIYDLVLRYVLEPPTLVNDSDQPTLSPAYHDLLVTYAVMRGFEAEDDPQSAGYWQAKWTRDLAGYKTEMNRRDHDRPHVVDGAWGR